MKSYQKIILPVTLLFLFINATVFFCSDFLSNKGLDKKVILYANLLSYVLNMLTLYMQSKSLKSTNPNSFVRAVMAGTMLKLLTAIIATVCYVYLSSTVSKPSIFVGLFIYFLYMILEVVAILKLNKK